MSTKALLFLYNIYEGVILFFGVLQNEIRVILNTYDLLFFPSLSS